MDYKNRKDFIKLYLGKDLSRKEMSNILKISPSTVDYWRKKHNIFGKNCQKLHRTYIKQLYKIWGCEFSVLGYYTGGNNKIKVKHNKCGNVYKVHAQSLLKGHICNKCAIKFQSEKMRKSNKQFLKEVYEKVDEDYIFLEKYKGSDTKIKVRHERCGNEYKVTPYKFIKQGRRCPYCNMSNAEEIITRFLENNNYIFEYQYKFNDLLSPKNSFLIFDFLIKINNENILLEYQGKQHYKTVSYFNDTKEILEYRNKCDKLKEKYCIDNEIPLIKIHYWEKDNIIQSLKKRLNNIGFYKNNLTQYSIF